MTPPVGRPEIGTPINIRLGDGLLDLVDAYAKSQEISRAEAVRTLLYRGIGDTPKGDFGLPEVKECRECEPHNGMHERRCSFR